LTAEDDIDNRHLVRRRPRTSKLVKVAIATLAGVGAVTAYLQFDPPQVEQRARLSILPKLKNVRLGAFAADADFQFEVSNSGQLPAHLASIQGNLYFSEINQIPIVPDLCREDANPNNLTGSTIAPQQSDYAIPIAILIAKRDLSSSNKNALAFAGCVIYQNTNDPAIYRTPFHYLITPKTGFFPTFGTLEQDQLLMVPVPDR
jgi:hypothetical protein